MAKSKVQATPTEAHLTPSVLAWLVWSLSCIFYFYECLLQVSPSVMSNELMRDFGVTSQTLGILSGIYFYSYAFMQLPGGVMMDQFGPRRLLTVATLICAISTITFGYTDNFYAACTARLMIGFGSAFAAVGAMKLAASWFPSNRFAFLTGLMVTIGMLGAIGGEAPMALLVDLYGWRHSMLIMGIVGLFLAFFIFFVIKDSPSKFVPQNENHIEDAPLFSSLITLLKNKQLWLIALYGGLMYMSTPVFCGLWGVPFLMIKLHLTKAMAANYISLIFIGWAVAGPLWGIYSNRIGKRKPSLYIASCGALITSLLFIYAPLESNLLMQFLLFIFGVFSAGFLPAFAVAKELCNKRYVATGLSFMNMMNMLGIAIAQPMIGVILDRLWTGELQDTVRVYSLGAYQLSLIILPIGIGISLAILPLVKETFCHNIWESEKQL